MGVPASCTTRLEARASSRQLTHCTLQHKGYAEVEEALPGFCVTAVAMVNESVMFNLDKLIGMCQNVTSMHGGRSAKAAYEEAGVKRWSSFYSPSFIILLDCTILELYLFFLSVVPCCVGTFIKAKLVWLVTTTPAHEDVQRICVLAPPHRVARGGVGNKTGVLLLSPTEIRYRCCGFIYPVLGKEPRPLDEGGGGGGSLESCIYFFFLMSCCVWEENLKKTKTGPGS